jgi:hypothetical protein
MLEPAAHRPFALAHRPPERPKFGNDFNQLRVPAGAVKHAAFGRRRTPLIEVQKAHA